MIEASPEDLTLRNDIAGALIAGGHWHGGGNYEICATIAHLCNVARERDELLKQRSAFANAIADRVAALEYAAKMQRHVPSGIIPAEKLA